MSAPVVAITAVGLLLRIPTLGTQSFWVDEAVTVRLTHMTLGHMLATIPHTESTPPLYYAVAWLWAQMFGYGEAGLRTLSVVCGVLTVPVAYRAATVLVSRKSGLVTGLLVATSPLLVWYSQEARAYALSILLGALSFLMFVHSLRQPTLRNLGLWTLMSALAIATHYFAAFLVVAEAGWLVATSPRRKSVALACLPWMATALALAPLALYQRTHADNTWIAASGSLPERFKEVVKSLMVGTNPPVTPWTALIAGVLVGVAVWLLVRRTDHWERKRALSAGGIGAIALLAPTLLDAAGFRYLDPRNVSICLLPLVIPVSVGLASRRAGRLGRLVLAALCVLSLGIVANVFANPHYQKEHWREVASALGSTRVPRAIVAQRRATQDLLDIYLPHTREMPSQGTAVQEIALVDATEDLGPPPHPPVPGFRLVAADRTDTTSIYRYSADRPVVVAQRVLLGHRLEPGVPTAFIALQLSG